MRLTKLDVRKQMLKLISQTETKWTLLHTLKAMEGQNFNASGVREFEGYRLYQKKLTQQQLQDSYQVLTK